MLVFQLVSLIFFSFFFNKKKNKKQNIKNKIFKFLFTISAFRISLATLTSYINDSADSNKISNNQTDSSSNNLMDSNTLSLNPKKTNVGRQYTCKL